MESGPIGNAAAFIDISRLENKVQLVLHSGHARGFPLDRPVTYWHIGRDDRLVGIGAHLLGLLSRVGLVCASPAAI